MRRPLSRPTSFGLLAFRRRAAGFEVFLVHPGGPFFRDRDDGAWTIPKGMPDPGETAGLPTARREFEEETGFATPEIGYLDLGEIAQKRKQVRAWAFAGEWDAAALRSNTFRLEWPPRSGHWQDVPEVDRGAWLAPDAARRKIRAAQEPLIDRLGQALAEGRAPI